MLLAYLANTHMLLAYLANPHVFLAYLANTHVLLAYLANTHVLFFNKSLGHLSTVITPLALLNCRRLQLL